MSTNEVRRIVDKLKVIKNTMLNKSQKQPPEKQPPEKQPPEKQPPEVFCKKSVLTNFKND